MWQRIKDKSHHHVQKSRTFSKGWAIGVLTIIPNRRSLIKQRHKLFFGHGPQTITIGVVKMRYPQDMEHLGYNIWSVHKARTSNASRKLRYWRIKSVHVGVELLNDHGGISDRGTTKWLPTLTVDDSGKCSVREIRQNYLVFQMNASSREVLWEVLKGFLISKLNRRRYRIRGRGCPRKQRVLGQSIFALGCHEATNARKRDRGGERDN